ncbi:hypothetical protein BS329_35245 [Amycolatopsis coloradensis]|uniref:Penicillin acylase family protein n=1 Tax=Amycolatopsis coloradensis TaxID=76021 RepID=A0A1R0KH68_9PSEU|nr:penicillin acylase family protein [Amycolatopsis coloradensis]OLZ45009.1 hypothetical protein BS329_35245 [Amycolatopsis coloradensis]
MALLLVVLVPSAFPVGGLPALGPVLNPGDGVWGRSAPVSDEAPVVPGLAVPAVISFEANGLAHVSAGSDDDLFLGIGYTHARQRLFQMDLLRRRAAGQLAEVLGASAVESDMFQLDLGLARSAERDWRELPRDAPARQVLLAYSDGVNAAIDELIARDLLPENFVLLGYAPRRWTPVDSLVVQRMFAQSIGFTDLPVTFSFLAKSLPADVFGAWFPEVPAIAQHPYDKGPYRKLPLTPAPVGADPAAHGADPVPGGGGGGGVPAVGGLAPLRERLADLPPGTVNRIGNSNAWAVSGAHTSTGRPMLAADPHLGFSLPAIWYQVEGTSPGYHFTGVTVPGFPAPVLGKTDRFAWGVTNAQRPTSLFYLEATDPARPDQYHWQGEWRPMTLVRNRIGVRGEEPREHVTRLTAHGPVLQTQGVATSLWWSGALPSDNLSALLNGLRAKDTTAFRASLSSWSAPALNFVYASPEDIGAFTVGVTPQVEGHDVALPLPGDGSADVAGAIPVAALPAVHDPADGVVVSANQREVTGDYPYRYSTSYGFPDQGWRAATLTAALSGATGRTADDMAALQLDERDELAVMLVPQLLKALQGKELAGAGSDLRAALAGWDLRASTGSAQAEFFERFATALVRRTFQPWWDQYHVPQDPDGWLPLSSGKSSPVKDVLRATVARWVVSDPGNRFFSLPDGTRRDATAVLREAFDEAVGQPAGQHTVRFPSLLGVPALDEGPFPAGGNSRTVNALSGETAEAGTAGPSWRFVVDWSAPQGAARAICPCGQSENPSSPWWANGVEPWRRGEYWQVAEGPAAEPVSTVKWRLKPR